MMQYLLLKGLEKLSKEKINISCSACKHKMINCGNIPDGIYFKCPNCGSKKIYLDDQSGLDDKTGYGNAYKEKLSPTKFQDLLLLFNKYFTYSDNNIQLLDVGFGSGDFLISLSERGLAANGLECDINSVKSLQRKNINAHFGELGGDLELDKNYGLVTLWDVIEHIHDVDNAMLQLSSITTKGGKIFILTPDADSIFDFIGTIERRLTFNKSQRIMSICLNRYHLHRFSGKGLKILLERFGFVVDHIEKLQLFSLKGDTYMNGFAPGIKSWTNSNLLNEFLSRSAITLIKSLRITNKIFITATLT